MAGDPATGAQEWGFRMPRTGKWLVSISVGLLLLLPSVSAQTGQTGIPPKARPKAGKAKTPPPQVVLPPLPRGPLPQVPLDQLPSAPPQVSYQDGMLTIVAQNSTLGDILSDVHECTRASIDVPPSATERVVTRLGPGPARDVLASLLNGTSFNYVMVGSASDPSSLASVLLTMKPTGEATPAVANIYQPPEPYAVPLQVQTVPPPVVTPQPAAKEEPKVETETAESVDQGQSQAQPSPNAPAPEGSQPNAGPMTREQILQMLRNAGPDTSQQIQKLLQHLPQ
jgi:hypothetical protein